MDGLENGWNEMRAGNVMGGASVSLSVPCLRHDAIELPTEQSSLAIVFIGSSMHRQFLLVEDADL
jgi:hypothetical protein